MIEKNKEKLELQYVNLYRQVFTSNEGLLSKNIKNMSVRELEIRIEDLKIALETHIL